MTWYRRNTGADQRLVAAQRQALLFGPGCSGLGVRLAILAEPSGQPGAGCLGDLSACSAQRWKKVKLMRRKLRDWQSVEERFRRHAGAAGQPVRGEGGGRVGAVGRSGQRASRSGRQARRQTLDELARQRLARVLAAGQGRRSAWLLDGRLIRPSPPVARNCAAICWCSLADATRHMRPTPRRKSRCPRMRPPVVCK